MAQCRLRLPMNYAIECLKVTELLALVNCLAPDIILVMGFAALLLFSKRVEISSFINARLEQKMPFWSRFEPFLACSSFLCAVGGLRCNSQKNRISITLV